MSQDVAAAVRPRWRRRLRIALLVLGVLLVALVIETVVFFIDPSTGHVDRPQAVVVLDGYGNRIARGELLARQQHVVDLVVSDPPYAVCPPATSRMKVYCFHPHPVSTQGEARAVAALARKHHWTRLLVVAGTTQVVRARLRLERCYSGQMAFSGVDPSGFLSWVYEISYDEVSMVKALVWQTGC